MISYVTERSMNMFFCFVRPVKWTQHDSTSQPGRGINLELIADPHSEQFGRYMCDHNSNDHQKKKSEDQESSRIPWLTKRGQKKAQQLCAIIRICNVFARMNQWPDLFGEFPKNLSAKQPSFKVLHTMFFLSVPNVVPSKKQTQFKNITKKNLVPPW